MRTFAWLVIFATGCGAGQGPSATPQSSPAAAGDSAAGTAAPSARGLLADICAETLYRAPQLQGATVRKLADGFAFVEGPVWIAQASALLFSDMQPSVGADNVQPSHVRRWTASAGAEMFLENAGSNGLALGGDGRLFACTHDQQVVSVFDLGTKTRSVAVERASGKRFNSPNDLTLRSDGTIYFTDPDWQKGNRPSETGITGVYRAGKDGQVTLVDGTLSKPNGVALSPDESALYVGAGDGKVRRYAVSADGSTGPAQPFAEVPVPDGMTVDCAGNVYATAHSAGEIIVLDPRGQKLGSIAVAPKLTNVAFGGADRRTLFATAGTALFAVDLDIAGAPY